MRFSNAYSLSCSIEPLLCIISPSKLCSDSSKPARAGLKTVAADVAPLYPCHSFLFVRVLYSPALLQGIKRRWHRRSVRRCGAY